MTRPFTQACLAAVHMMKLGGLDNAQMAFTLGRPAVEIDRASWALVGRSIPDAVAALNRPTIVPEIAA